ncbi:MAG TPA: DUF1330 domain-containing protein [Steroidobacteraceae bacterium]|jgi:uncharacterized protein (DUF1330 family)|nr:DUF1330 domain-containing protein [Steroidobacteraceae bacterium]
MAKAYWVVCYREIKDPAKLAEYAKLAGPAVQAHGGRFLGRGVAAKAHELGKLERTVIIEFDSLERAVAAHDSPAYGEALQVLEGFADRDFRILEGV